MINKHLPDFCDSVLYLVQVLVVLSDMLLIFQSPYEGGLFKLELFLPEEYPMSAPKVRFMTKIYHPNIDKLGRICLDILKGNLACAVSVSCVHFLCEI